MSAYPTLMDTDLEKFEHVFYYKKKSLEEFLTLMTERADLEEYYANAIDRMSANLTVYAEKGPLAEILDSLNSYHSIKSHQSRIFSKSVQDEVIQPLKDLLKKETTEARKMLNGGRRNDTEMRMILERIEAAKRKYININSDTEETQKTKAALFSSDATDAATEERRKSVLDRLSKLAHYQFDCDVELKNHIEEYNKFRTSFNEQCNNITNFFKQFETNRLNSIRDSTMKYFVYEISYFRNIQYDVNKIIHSIENEDPNKVPLDLSLYKTRIEPAALDFDQYKETFIQKKPESKPKSTNIFEKSQIPENLGKTFKSVMGFFSNPKSVDTKKRDEEGKFIEKQWNLIRSGQTSSEDDDQTLVKSFTQDYNRKLFMGQFSKVEINLSELTPENYDKARAKLLRVLCAFAVEAWKNQDWESLKLYIVNIRALKDKFKVDAEKVEQEGSRKTNIYAEIDESVRSLEVFNNENAWRDYLSQSVSGKEKTSHKIDKWQKLGSELDNIRHFIHDKDQLRTIVRPVAINSGIADEDVDNLLEGRPRTIFNEPAEQSKQEKENQKEEGLEDWLQKMEKKIIAVGKSQRIGGSIFSKKPENEPKNPPKRIFDEERVRPDLIEPSQTENIYRSPERPVKQNEDEINTNQEEQPREEKELREISTNIENSNVDSVSTNVEDINTNSMA